MESCYSGSKSRDVFIFGKGKAKLSSQNILSKPIRKFHQNFKKNDQFAENNYMKIPILVSEKFHSKTDMFESVNLCSLKLFSAGRDQREAGSLLP